jgi:hypothetical protein
VKRERKKKGTLAIAIANSRIERPKFGTTNRGLSTTLPPLPPSLGYAHLLFIFFFLFQSLRIVHSVYSVDSFHSLPTLARPASTTVPPFFASLYTYTSLIITLCYPRASAPPPTPRLVLLSLSSSSSSFPLRLYTNFPISRNSPGTHSRDHALLALSSTVTFHFL